MSVACRVFIDAAADGEMQTFVALPRIGEKIEIAGETLTVQSVTHVPGGASEEEARIVVSTRTLGH